MKHIKKLILFIVIALSTACNNNKDIITIDTHIDINVENFTDSLNYTMNTDTQFNLPNMMKGDLDVAWLVVYTAQGELNEEGYKAAYENAISNMECITTIPHNIPISIQTTFVQLRLPPK